MAVGRSAGEVSFQVDFDTSLLGNTLRAQMAAATREINRSFARSIRDPFPALTGSSKQMLASVNGLGSAVGGLGNKLNNLPVAAVTALTAAFAAAAAAAVGLAVTVAKIGLESASSLQNVELAMESLGKQLKDISAADAISQMRDLSVVSGISLGVISKIEQGFVSLGLSGREGLSIIQTEMAALAAAGALSEGALSNLSRAIRQIGSKPFLQLEELNQIAEHLPITRLQVAGKIAKNTGDTMAEVQERFKLGTQSYGDALTAVIESIGDLDKSGKALERRNQTLGGSFDSLKQRINLALGDVFKEEGGPASALVEAFNGIDVDGLVSSVAKPISDALADVIPTLVEALPGIVSALALAFKAMVPFIKGAAEGASKLAEVFVNNQGAINAALSDVGDFLGGLKAAFSEILPELQPVVAQLLMALDVLGKFGRALEFMAPVFKAVGRGAAIALAPFNVAMDLALHSIEQMLEAVGLIPEGIPFLGSVSRDASQAAASVHALRLQLSGLGSAAKAVSDPDGALASMNALNDPSFLKSLEQPFELKFPKFPGAEGGGGGGAAAAAARTAEAAAKALRTALDSVFKNLNAFGKRAGKQTLSVLKGNYERVVESMKSAIEKASEAGNRSVAVALQKQLARFKEGNKRLVAMAKARDKVLDQLQAAKDNLKALREESVGFMDGIKTAVRDLGSVMRDTGGIDVTFTGMRNNFRKAIAQTQAFTNAINQLRDLGLNETTLRQLAEAGPAEGLRQAMVLARSGAAGVSQVNAFQSELEAAGQTLASGLNSEFYTAGISAAEGLVKGLDSQRDKIVAAMDKIADTLVKRIKQKLKIASPSAIMEEDVMMDGVIGGLVRGAGRGEKAVAAAMERVAQQTINLGGVSVNGVSDPNAARKAGIMAGLGIQQVLEGRQMAAKLAGVG